MRIPLLNFQATQNIKKLTTFYILNFTFRLPYFISQVICS